MKLGPRHPGTTAVPPGSTSPRFFSRQSQWPEALECAAARRRRQRRAGRRRRAAKRAFLRSRHRAGGGDLARDAAGHPDAAAIDEAFQGRAARPRDPGPVLRWRRWRHDSAPATTPSPPPVRRQQDLRSTIDGPRQAHHHRTRTAADGKRNDALITSLRAPGCAPQQNAL